MSRRAKPLVAGTALTLLAALTTIAIIRYATSVDPEPSQPPTPATVLGASPPKPIVVPIESVKPTNPVPSVTAIKAAPPSDPVTLEPPVTVTKTPPQEPPRANVVVTPDVTKTEPRPQPKPKQARVATRADVSEAKSRAAALFRIRRFNDAASTLRASATGPASSELRNLAGIYEQFGRKFLVGMAATTPAASAWDLLKSAEAFDKDNVFRQDIESRLGQIATKAALGFVGAKNYFKALQAVKLAEQSGATASTRIVRDKIEEFAGELYSQAVAEIDVKPKEAKAKLQQIKGLVDAKNPWAVKATKLLDAP